MTFDGVKKDVQDSVSDVPRDGDTEPDRREELRRGGEPGPDSDNAYQSQPDGGERTAYQNQPDDVDHTAYQNQPEDVN